MLQPCCHIVVCCSVVIFFSILHLRSDYEAQYGFIMTFTLIQYILISTIHILKGFALGLYESYYDMHFGCYHRNLRRYRNRLVQFTFSRLA
jgi:hypothetical protein